MKSFPMSLVLLSMLSNVAGAEPGADLMALRSPRSYPDGDPELVAYVTTPAPAERPIRWYGWQPMLFDAAAFALVAAEAETAGVTVFLVGAPAVHAGQGNYGRAVGSAAMRLVLPTLGLLMTGEYDEECECYASAGAGPAMGLLAAMTIDYLIAYVD